MTTGEGGMAFTDDGELNRIMRSLREFGRFGVQEGWGERDNEPGDSMGFYHSAYVFDRLGWNLRMTDLEAAIGLEQLKKLDGFNERRRQIAKRITTRFNVAPDSRDYSPADAPYAVVIHSKQRDKLALFLESKGIETRPFMGGNLLRQKAFSKWGNPVNYPDADYLHKNALLVGCHPAMTDADADYVAACLLEFTQEPADLSRMMAQE
jgi:CDP-6-deoxy-D-xylo-4-hexulose-3-dehydrase